MQFNRNGYDGRFQDSKDSTETGFMTKYDIKRNRFRQKIAFIYYVFVTMFLGKRFETNRNKRLNASRCVLLNSVVRLKYKYVLLVIIQMTCYIHYEKGKRFLFLKTNFTEGKKQ